MRLPVASSSVARRPGSAIFSGMPGTPAPLPTSSSVERLHLRRIGDRRQIHLLVRRQQQLAVAPEQVQLPRV
jgi:hypothetical protein